MQLSHALYSILWSLPVILVGLATVALALLRRDSGLWWKLVLAGGALLVANSLLSLGQQTLITGGQVDISLLRLLGIGQTVLLVTAFGLIVAGALVDRRRPTQPLTHHGPR